MSLLWHRSVLNIESWVLQCLCHFIGTVAQNLRGGRLLLLFNAVLSDSAEFLSCVESTFYFALWNKVECWWCDSTGRNSLSLRVCKCDLLLGAIAVFWKIVFLIYMAAALNFWTLYRNNNRKKFRNYWVLYQVRNVCQWELPASITATPANWTTILCMQGKYLWAGWLQSWVCCPPCRLSCQPKGWCAVQVGRSCCVKGWELLSVVLPSESCSSGVQFHYSHFVTAKPVQSQPFPSFNCPFPLPSSKYAGP